VPPDLAAALAEAFVLGAHVLGGGVWIGAMVFSVFILQPRADRFFTARGAEGDFEDFIFTVVHGARWKVAAGIAAVAVSGLALAAWPGHAWISTPLWMAALAGKLIAFVVATGCFAYVSWVLWPRRAFANEDELPAIKALFFRVGAVMVVANVINMALGIGAHVIRG
jgi:hypothetical protein